MKLSFSMAIMSDLHLRPNEASDSSEYHRYQEKLSVLRQAVDFSIENNHDALVLAGDTFDIREPPDWLMAEFVKALSGCFPTGVQVYILVGNHETNGATHCYKTLQELESITVDAGYSWPIHVIDQPCTVRNGCTLINFVPYMKSGDTIEAVTNWSGHQDPLGEGFAKILIGHFSVDGAVLSGGNAYQIPTVLKKHHFDGYNFVILGHIHQRQIYWGDDLTWGYAGSPLHQDFGEVEDDTKGFYELKVFVDESYRKVSSIDLSTIPTTSTPFIEVELQEGDALDKEVRSAMSGKICKLILSGSDSWLRSEEVTEIKRKCRAAVKNGKVVKIITSTRCTDREITPEEQNEEPSAKLDDSLQKLCKEKDKEAFLPHGRNFLEEANNALARA